MPILFKETSEQQRFTLTLIALTALAVLIVARTVWIFLNDAQHFPINTIQIKSKYQCLTHKEVQSILQPLLAHSFFTIPNRQIHKRLQQPCINHVRIKKEWPDKLILYIYEKDPYLRFNNTIIDEEGNAFSTNKSIHLPNLTQMHAPPEKRHFLLAQYKNLSKILSGYGLSASIVTVTKNGDWEMVVNNFVKLRLGKTNLETRLRRFGQAHVALESKRNNPPLSVDLRYQKGMAVQWRV